jgi:hypothetical protein
VESILTFLASLGPAVLGAVACGAMGIVVAFGDLCRLADGDPPGRGIRLGAAWFEAFTQPVVVLVGGLFLIGWGPDLAGLFRVSPTGGDGCPAASTPQGTARTPVPGER